MFSRQSSVKVMSSSENLAEQLVVWLTSQGKRSMSLKKKRIYIQKGMLKLYPLFRHHSGLHAYLHIHTCPLKPVCEPECAFSLLGDMFAVWIKVLILVFNISVLLKSFYFKMGNVTYDILVVQLWADNSIKHVHTTVVEAFEFHPPVCVYLC